MSKYNTMGENSGLHANKHKASNMGGKQTRKSTYDMGKEEGKNEHALDFQTMLAEARKSSAKGAQSGRSTSRSKSASGGMGTSTRFTKVEKTGPASSFNANDHSGIGAGASKKKGIMTNTAGRFKDTKSDSPGPGAASGANQSSFSQATKTFSTKQTMGGGVQRDIFGAQERRAKEVPSTSFEGKSIGDTVKSSRPSSAFSSSTGRMAYQKPATETPSVGAYENNQTGIKAATKQSAAFKSSTGRMQHQKLPDTPAVGQYR
jgi:hypothetical protein